MKNAFLSGSHVSPVLRSSELSLSALKVRWSFVWVFFVRALYWSISMISLGAGLAAMCETSCIKSLFLHETEREMWVCVWIYLVCLVWFQVFLGSFFGFFKTLHSIDLIKCSFVKLQITCLVLIFSSGKVLSWSVDYICFLFVQTLL